MKWVLIVVFLGWGHNGVTKMETRHLEFDTILICLQGKKIIEGMRPGIKDSGNLRATFDMLISQCIKTKE